MGKFNILTGALTGKLGQIVGQRYKGRNVVRTKSETVVHQSANQQKSLSAFGKMNKLASFLAKNAWDILGLSDKTMLRHNAVAHLLKPVIRNKDINFSYWNEIAPKLSTFHIAGFSRESGAGPLKVRFAPDRARQAPPGANIIICIADQDCGILDYRTATLPTPDFDFPAPGDLPGKYHALLFVCAEKNNAFHLIGADAAPLEFIAK